MTGPGPVMRPRTGHTHDCPGDCGAQVPWHLLACKSDWNRLPWRIRQRVTTTYRCRAKDPAAYRDALAEAHEWYRHNPRQAHAAPGPGDRPPQIRANGQCESTLCRAPIIWARGDHDTRLPVDVEPIRVTSIRTADGPQHYVLLKPQPGRDPIATLVTPAALFGRRWCWRRHIDTCPDAAHYRRAAIRRAARRPPP